MSSLLSIVPLLLVFPIHELGHYIFARMFGWDPSFHINKNGLYVMYHVIIKENPNKVVITSFFGVIGIIPYLLYCLVSNSLLNGLPLIIFLFSYSLFEMICRWRKVNRIESSLS